MAMQILDADFSDGDFLTAGTVISTSGLNGITTSVNSNTLTRLMYLASDLGETTIASSTSETTLLNVSIPANTITTGAIYLVSFRAKAVGATATATFTAKSGVAASEVTRESYVINRANPEEFGCNIAWYDAAVIWSGDVSVIITGTNSTSNANVSITAHSLVVFGF